VHRHSTAVTSLPLHRPTHPRPHPRLQLTVPLRGCLEAGYSCALNTGEPCFFLIARHTAARDLAAVTAFQIPTIETPRLRLRGFTESDFPAYRAMVNDPNVMRYLGDGRPLDEIDAWRQLAFVLGHWVLRGFGLWAVEERASGRLVGRVGLLEPSGWPGFEVAYTIAPAVWKQGYAREAAGAALRHAQDVLGRTDIISIIRPDNVASVRVATALGATHSHAIEFFGAPADIYRYAETPTG
jgi:RimJ/RimL family protein N-acetyltransferase